MTASQKDPLPRTVSMGENIEASLKYALKDQWIEVLSWAWTREAEDLLIKSLPNRPYMKSLDGGTFASESTSF